MNAYLLKNNKRQFIGGCTEVCNVRNQRPYVVFSSHTSWSILINNINGELRDVIVDVLLHHKIPAQTGYN